MQRCAHGVYLPAWAVDGRNPYCSACDCFGQVPHEKSVELPRSSSDPLNTRDKLHANAKSNGACPQCGSHVWMRQKEVGSDSQRECGECGTKFRVKLTVHQQAARLFAEHLFAGETECLA